MTENPLKYEGNFNIIKFQPKQTGEGQNIFPKGSTAQHCSAWSVKM
jgi:hypothetical protein